MDIRGRLGEIVRKHHQWLQNGEGARADLSGKVLPGVSLEYEVLNQACLVDADLSGAYLDSSFFSGADCRRLKLASASMYKTCFDGADLGEVNLGGSVTLAAEAQTWNRTFGQEVDMGWSINGGNVSWHELGYLSNVGDNNTLWQSPGFNGVNVADGLGVGEYDVAVFFRATQDGDDAVWDSNAGNNYTASFEVIPEPTTIGLIGLGLAGLLVARPRRA